MLKMFSRPSQGVLRHSLQPQQRWLSLSKPQSSRRKPRSRPTTGRQTVRDRMRQLNETNQLPPGSSNVFSLDRTERMLQVAQSRITFFRDKLYEYWNPDYLKQQPGARRPIGTVMDQRWWIWNVGFALLPATLLALYCETRGKQRYEAHLQRQRQEEDEAKQPSPQDPQGGRQTAAPAQSEVGILESLVMTIMSALYSEDQTDAEEDVPSPSGVVPSAADETQQQQQQLPKTDEQHSSDTSLETILQRLEKLERMVGSSTPPSPLTETGTASTNVPSRPSNVSGIRWRYEEAKRRQVEEEEQKKHEEAINNAPTKASWEMTFLAVVSQAATAARDVVNGVSNVVTGDDEKSPDSHTEPSRDEVSEPSIDKEPDSQNNKAVETVNEAVVTADADPSSSQNPPHRPWWKVW